MEPLLVLGPLSITPYSLMIFSGAVIGTLLAARKKAVRPALPLTALLALILGHVVWCLMNDTSMEYYGSSLLFHLRMLVSVSSLANGICSLCSLSVIRS